MYGRAALALLLFTGCISSNDAVPAFESMRIADVDPEATVEIGTTLSVVLTGTELWDRTVMVIIESELDGVTTQAGTAMAKFGLGNVQQATLEWTVAGRFLRKAGRHRVTFVARFEDAEIRSNAFFVEVAPALNSVEFLGRSGGLRGGEVLDVEVRGEDVFGQTVGVVLRLGDSQLLHAEEAEFVTDARGDVAQISWTVDGAFLDEQQNTELVAIAAFDQLRATSAPITVNIDPALIRVRTDVAAADPGDPITVEVDGRDVWSRPVEVDVMRSSSGAPASLETTLDLKFDDRSVATAMYTIPTALEQRPERHEFTFTARYASMEASSAPVVVDVVPAVRDITIFHTPSGGTRTMVGASDAPYVDQFTAVIDGIALVAQDLAVEIRYDGSMVDRIDMTASANDFEVEHSPTLALLNGRERVQMTVVIFRQGAEIGRSGSATIARRGVRRCYWATASGTEYADRDEVDAGTGVRLEASSWGLDGQSAVWEVWESDDRNDDHVFTFQTTIAGDVPNFDWTTEYVDDGVLNSTDEYYFRLRVQNVTCQSPILAVHE